MSNGGFIEAGENGITEKSSDEAKDKKRWKMKIEQSSELLLCVVGGPGTLVPQTFNHPCSRPKVLLVASHSKSQALPIGLLTLCPQMSSTSYHGFS